MKPIKDILKQPSVKAIEAGSDGCAFTYKTATSKLLVIASIGGGWDHVSVSHRSRLPTYREMKIVKRLCFGTDEWAIEYHPPEKDYISINDNVLHMWRPRDVEIPVPPKTFI